MNTATAQPPVMKPAEVAEALCVSPKTVWAMSQPGGPLAPMVIRVGPKQTHYRYRREAFQAWLQNGGR